MPDRPEATGRLRGRVTRAGVAAAALLATVGLLLAPLPPTLLGPWQGKLLDLGHVPLFAVLVVVLRLTFRVSLVWPLLVAVVVAAGAEVVQPRFGRTRDWVDFAGGALGAFSGVAALLAWKSRRSPRRLALFLLLTLALPAWPVAHALPYIRDTIAGRRAFPVLIDFTTDDQQLRWEVKQATVGRDGAVELRPGGDVFSWFAFRPVKGDFRGYGYLCCELEVVGESVDLVTSVRTAAGGGSRTNHAQVGRRYPPGGYVLRFELAALEAWAEKRGEPLDLADVRWIQFFVVKVPAPRTVVMRRVWLER